jgi:integrase
VREVCVLDAAAQGQNSLRPTAACRRSWEVALPEDRLGDLDAQRLRGFVDWLCRQHRDDRRRLCDRSVHNAVLPLRACLRHAAGVGLVVGDVDAAIVLPRRRRGRAYEHDERRFLSRRQLARLLAEIHAQWRPLFELLASTGLRISEAIGLRVMDAGQLSAGVSLRPRPGAAAS